jgi:hypothetical protein
MNNLFLTESQKEAKGLSLGILAMENLRQSPAAEKMDAAKRGLEDALRVKYRDASRADLKVLHPLDTYIAYYKKFGYTYHVLPQLESVVKGKRSFWISRGGSHVHGGTEKPAASRSPRSDRISAPLFLKVAAGVRALQRWAAER